MNRLSNVPFHSMHRVLDMLCLNFGNTYREETITIGSQTISHRIFPTYSLHLQTPWRFVFQDKIILGSGDIYEPFAEDVGDNWDYAPTERCDDESSVFDVVSKKVASALNGHFVTQGITSPTGDIRLIFSNGCIFETFIPTSRRDEQWRLIDFETGEHFVFHDADD